MASSAQMKSLLNSHYIGDDEHFNTVALQIAAAEAGYLYITILIIYKLGVLLA